MARTVKIAADFEAAALRVMRSIPGVEVVRTPGRGPDAVVHVGNAEYPMLVEFKTRANAAAAWQCVRHASAHPGTPLLLVAGQTTEEARAILSDHGIAVVDGLGNADMVLPGLLLHMEGRRATTAAGPTRLAGKAGVVAQALLLDPMRAWRVQDLADRSGVSDGLAHRVLVRLEREGVVAAVGAGPRRFREVTDRSALLDLWAEETRERAGRVLGFALAPTPHRLVKQVSRGLDRAGLDHAVTGAAAAGLVAPFSTAVPVVEVWVDPAASPEELVEACDAEAVTEGHNVVFRQAKDDTPLAFRERIRGTWLANTIRIYGDLLRDPRRGREQAEHLRREVIGF